MTHAFCWQKSVSLCPASFCTPRPNLPVTPGISWLPTFVFQSPMMKRTFLGGLMLEGEKAMASHSSTLAWRIPWMEDSGRLQSIWSRRVGHDWATEANWTEQDLLKLTPKKDVLFITGDWNAKVGSQEIPGVTGKFGLGVQNEAGQRLIEFCQENALVITNTVFQQHKIRLYIWTSSDSQCWNQIDYILCSQRWRSSTQSAKTRLRADYGSDHELLIAKFRLKLKKVGKNH